MKDRRVLVVAGMHRSGTSAVASLMQRAGVYLGSRLVPGDAGNPRGYFEDEDFVHFHDRQLARSGLRVLAQGDAGPEPFGDDEVLEAEDLVRRRREHSLWGWKDPRTSLFLDFWAERLPEARFVFPVRDPFEVVLSLLRRGSGHELEVMANPLVGVRSWRFYNRSILDFYERYADRCFLADVHQVFADAAGFVEAVAAKLDLSLRPESVAGMLHPEELHRRPASEEADAILERADPQAGELARRLAAAADWTAGVSPPARDAALGSSLCGLRKLYDAAGDPQVVARPVFALALAFFDPEAVSGASPGAQVLDLLDRIASLRKHADNLLAEIARRDDRVAQLEAHAGNLEEWVPELEAHAGNLEARVAELARHAGNLEARSAYDQQRSDELGRHASALEELAAERSARVEELGKHAGNLEVLMDHLRWRASELEKHAGNLEALVGQREEQLRDVKTHAENLEQLRSADLHQLAEIERHAENLESRRRQDEDRLAALGVHVANLEHARSEDRKRLRELEEHADALRRELALREARLATLAELSAAKADLEQQVESRDRRLRELEARQAELAGDLERREAAVTGLQGEARRLGGELEELLGDLRALATSSWVRLLRHLHLLR
jgi:predicted  nucleic acid-binding Zn-ribbon protein